MKLSTSVVYNECIVGSGAAALNVVGNAIGTLTGPVHWQSTDFNTHSFEYENESVGKVKAMIDDLFKINEGFKSVNPLLFTSIKGIYEKDEHSKLKNSDLQALHIDLTAYLKSKTIWKVAGIQSLDINVVPASFFGDNDRVTPVIHTTNNEQIKCNLVRFASGVDQISTKSKLMAISNAREIPFEPLIDSTKLRPHKGQKIVIVGSSINAAYALKGLYELGVLYTDVLLLTNNWYPLSHYNLDNQKDYLPINNKPNLNWPIRMVKSNSPSFELTNVLKGYQAIYYANDNDQFPFETTFKIQSFFSPSTMKGSIGYTRSIRDPFTPHYYFYNTTGSLMDINRSVNGYGPTFEKNVNCNQYPQWCDGTGLFKYRVAY